MLDFIPAAVRKRIYQWLAAINAIVGPVLGTLLLAGVVTDAMQQQILGIAASVMSSAAFLLAAKNTDTSGDG